MCEANHFSGCTRSFLCHFLSLFWPTPSLSSTPILRMKNKFLLHKTAGELVPPASPVPMALNSNMHKMCSPVYLSNCQLFGRDNQLFRRDKNFYQQIAKMIHWKWMQVFQTNEYSWLLTIQQCTPWSYQIVFVSNPDAFVIHLGKLRSF